MAGVGSLCDVGELLARFPVAQAAFGAAVAAMQCAGKSQKAACAAVAAAARGAVQGLGAGDGKEVATQEFIGNLDEALLGLQAIMGVVEPPKVEDAKRWLRDHGGGQAATALGKLSAARNLDAHSAVKRILAHAENLAYVDKGIGLEGEGAVVGEHKLRQKDNSQNDAKVGALAATVKQRDLQLAEAKEALKQQDVQMKELRVQLEKITAKRDEYAECLALQTFKIQSGQLEIHTADAKMELRAKQATLEDEESNRMADVLAERDYAISRVTSLERRMQEWLKQANAGGPSEDKYESEWDAKTRLASEAATRCREAARARARAAREAATRASAASDVGP